ncbi:hypothetical protein D9611_003751 [Ephemerocybe angulata]|uniref:Uncharacterized protein n=1 Tax=Ephemerocybe angulata TaxID=980116 RepID=A0A8H5B617_9AGAR|nr:hypothetical protein D9611_003751 [Tulosesus angulatus]
MFQTNDLLDQVCILASACLETLFYGFYACLFMLAVYLMTRKQPGQGRPAASKVFLGAIILMFVTATLHEVITIYRVLRAYGFMLGPKGTPISYIQTTAWDNYAHTVMNGLMAWIADALVIYRCYLIWGNSFYVIILPTIITITTMGVNLTLWIWWRVPFTDYKGITVIMNLGYPFLFAQNVLTTGLIAWKIIRQHRRSKSSGLVMVTTSNMTLVSVARIIIESALLYTLILLLVIIFYFWGHPMQYVIRGAIIPSIGIVFVLIAIRVHGARNDFGSSQTTTVPTWVLSDHPVFRHTLRDEEALSDYDIKSPVWSMKFPKAKLAFRSTQV